jgi:hypothetical protein
MTHPKGTTNHDQDAIHRPSNKFSAFAHIPSMEAYQKLYQESIDMPDKF